MDLYINDPHDKGIINKLVKEDNEFILAAFDVFRSDKD